LAILCFVPSSKENVKPGKFEESAILTRLETEWGARPNRKWLGLCWCWEAGLDWEGLEPEELLPGVNGPLHCCAEADGNLELLMRDRTREMALRLSKSEAEDGPAFKLLFVEGRVEEKTEAVVDMTVSEVVRFGTETLLGFMETVEDPAGERSTSGLICFPGGVTGLSPKTPLLFVPSHTMSTS